MSKPNPWTKFIACWNHGKSFSISTGFDWQEIQFDTIIEDLIRYRNIHIKIYQRESVNAKLKLTFEEWDETDS